MDMVAAGGEQREERPAERRGHRHADQGVHRRRGMAKPTQAVRCSGQAPHTATGAASTRLTHGQPVNCAAGTMASTIDRDGERDTDGQPPAERAGRLVRGHVVGPGVGRGRLGRIPARFDHADQVGGLTAAQVREVGAPGGVVDAGGHPVELVQPPLDPRRAGATAHPTHDQLGLHGARAGSGPGFPGSHVAHRLTALPGRPDLHGPPMFIEPPPPPSRPGYHPSRPCHRRAPDRAVPGVGELTVTGPGAPRRRTRR